MIILPSTASPVSTDRNFQSLRTEAKMVKGTMITHFALNILSTIAIVIPCNGNESIPTYHFTGIFLQMAANMLCTFWAFLAISKYVEAHNQSSYTHMLTLGAVSDGPEHFILLPRNTALGKAFIFAQLGNLTLTCIASAVLLSNECFIQGNENSLQKIAVMITLPVSIFAIGVSIYAISLPKRNHC